LPKRTLYLTVKNSENQFNIRYSQFVDVKGQFTPTTQTWLNSTQLLSQASKQRVVCAQQRDVTMLMTSLRCHPVTTVELSCRCELVKPKFHYADFHWNFPAGKVVDTNHESRRQKWWQIMKPWSFSESRQHKSQKSVTQIMKVGDMICVVNFRDLCLRLSLRGSFGKSREVGVMEFWLYIAFLRTTQCT